jgi:hypothetical protein
MLVSLKGAHVPVDVQFLITKMLLFLFIVARNGDPCAMYEYIFPHEVVLSDVF